MPNPNATLFEKLIHLHPTASPETFTKPPPHWSVFGRPVFGAALIAQSLSAASQTLPSPTYLCIHSLAAQFLPGGAAGHLPLTIHVEKTSDGKNSATRTVYLEQETRRVFVVIMGFGKGERREGSELNYQTEMPVVEKPLEGVDDYELLAGGMVLAQGLGRVMSESSSFHPLRLEGRKVKGDRPRERQ